MVFDFGRRSKGQVAGQVGMDEETNKSKRTKSQVAKSKRRFLPSPKERFEVGRRAGTFVAVGAQQRQDFSREQEMMGEMFGHGDKIWGVNNEPVKLYSDLNPRQRGDDGTASLFGFGGRN